MMHHGIAAKACSHVFFVYYVMLSEFSGTIKKRDIFIKTIHKVTLIEHKTTG